MKKTVTVEYFIHSVTPVTLCLFLPMLISCDRSKQQSQSGEFAGSLVCRECHEEFYSLWENSLHGTTMQSFTVDFFKTKLTPQKNEIVIGDNRYITRVTSGKGFMHEQRPNETKKYLIKHALGGKDIFYFLTPIERGRLQVLPVAYDVRKKEWFHTSASSIRHFTGLEDEVPLDWKDWRYTFNRACYNCHVSQLSNDYDQKTDTFNTTWAEPGINCETCHGPSAEHIKVCRETPFGQPSDLKIIRGGRDWTVEQNNMACASCHAVLIPLTHTFKGGDQFFDHFDLVSLEHTDFYPDGRELGETYTYTLWRMSPCAKSGQLSCLHCHTSSGHYRFASKGQENNACLPCHQKRVENASSHTHHKANSKGNKCISCHMPMTEFARMRRSDHSLLPPTPSTTIIYKAPNACNICHKDKDASWADAQVRSWHKEDYQAPILHRAALIQAARDQDWSKLVEICAYLDSEDSDEIFSTALIRLLSSCPDRNKWPAIRRALNNASPLVRSAATASMAHHLTPDNIVLLLKALRDSSLLVRIRAAESLANLSPVLLNKQDRRALENASAEFEATLKSRPYDSISQYNLANFYMQQGKLRKAVQFYKKTLEIQPDSIELFVNLASAYAKLGNNEKAHTSLAKALKIDPNNAVANFNMGLLKAEKRDPEGAEKHLRRALESNPEFPVAAHNLGVLISEKNLTEAIRWTVKAHELSPSQPRYGYSAAVYLHKHKQDDKAIELLKGLIEQHPRYGEAYVLLGTLYENKKAHHKAADIYHKALSHEGLSPRYRMYFKKRMKKFRKINLDK